MLYVYHAFRDEEETQLRLSLRSSRDATGPPTSANHAVAILFLMRDPLARVFCETSRSYGGPRVGVAISNAITFCS